MKTIQDYRKAAKWVREQINDELTRTKEDMKHENNYEKWRYLMAMEYAYEDMECQLQGVIEELSFEFVRTEVDDDALITQYIRFDEYIHGYIKAMNRSIKAVLCNSNNPVVIHSLEYSRRAYRSIAELVDNINKYGVDEYKKLCEETSQKYEGT